MVVWAMCGVGYSLNVCLRIKALPIFLLKYSERLGFVSVLCREGLRGKPVSLSVGLVLPLLNYSKGLMKIPFHSIN